MSSELPHRAAKVVYTSAGTDPQGKPVLTVYRHSDGGRFEFVYGDGARFGVDDQGHEVWADWPDGYTFEDAATYLMGPILGLVLRLHRVTPLHASVVAVDEKAVALVGSPGSGKSTTAAAFACLGYPVLSDDMAPLVDGEHSLLTQAGYPRVNLWPDAVRLLFGSEDALPRVTPTWDKCFLALDQPGYHFRERPLPLAAIYILGKREASRTRTTFKGLVGWPALQSLMANTYVNYLLDAQMQQREFEILCRLVECIPVRRVAPADRTDPFCLCEAIVGNVRELVASGSVAPTGEPSRNV